MSLFRVSAFPVSVGVGLILASLAAGFAEQPPIIHYAPAENLEHIDVALIDQAQSTIDIAALSWPIGR
ncbi:hypothetical protein [Methylocapsa aurea]|uniref:hypothetical protein n=1 Tax=Methylocapsa aurea TaxID=663610 RepID=UPI00068C107C|nr:hypothetical protein [Methylocapsa aurea]